MNDMQKEITIQINKDRKEEITTERKNKQNNERSNNIQTYMKKDINQ